ncbi:MAG: hypothetical protein JXQ27_10220 [Acidobacteria bacterium]|nr:hypothetical protein [Acidobacteriota bacterium]
MAKSLRLESYFYGILPDEETTVTVLPYVMGHFHYDKYDVRSGTKHSDELCLAVPIEAQGFEITCTPEDIIPVQPDWLHPLPQKTLKLDLWNGSLQLELFHFLEESLLDFVCRHYRIRIFRNFELGLFSRYNEPRDMFEDRCLDRSEELFHRHLPEIKARYDRQLEQFKNKYLSGYHHVSGGEYPARDDARDQLYTYFLYIREQITHLFSRMSYLSDSFAAKTAAAPPRGHELLEDLERLRSKARDDIRNLAAEFRPVVKSVEEYTISLAQGELILDQITLLWKPED